MSNLEYASRKGTEAVKSIMSGERVDIITAGMVEICMEYLAEILDELKSMREDCEQEWLKERRQEWKKGKWIYLDGLDAFECSVCGRQMVRNIFDYCPWCGAEMRGEDNAHDI